MWRRASLIGVLSLAVVSLGVSGATASKRDVLHANNAHEFAAKGAGPGGGGKSPPLTYHGGPVQHSTSVTAIFWGASWLGSPGDKVTGIDTFYNGVGGTNYAGTNTEYTDGSGHVSASVTYTGHQIDTSAAPGGAPSTSAVLAEVAKVITSPQAGAYYPVYIDQPRGNAGYCAWHSAGTIGTTPVQFAFFFKLDGDSGCDPKDTSGNHSQGLAALGNVTGHELSEMLTDPKLNAWYDRSGAENSDKCAWTFGSSLVSFGSSSWKIQGNWSNAAYTANAGYPARRGCIDGN
jgi:hypothetical protein